MNYVDPLRRTGRTTNAMVKMIYSNIPFCIYLSPTMPMAKYNFEFFMDILKEKFGEEAEIKAIKSQMRIIHCNKSYFFMTPEYLKNNRNMMIGISFETHEDHTVNERPWSMA